MYLIKVDHVASNKGETKCDDFTTSQCSITGRKLHHVLYFLYPFSTLSEVQASLTLWTLSIPITRFRKIVLSLYKEKGIHVKSTFFLDDINATASLWVAEAKGSLSTLKNWSPAFIPCDSAIDPTSTDETKCPTPCSTPPRRLNPKWDCTSSPLSRTKVINWPSTFESSCIFLLPESEKWDKEIYWMM